eukprot:13574628-Heterocapsa_arctica.AAC.1
MMLLREPVQEAPVAGGEDFPPLPEPLRPIGTRQGQAPANSLPNPEGDRSTGSQGAEGEAV